MGKPDPAKEESGHCSGEWSRERTLALTLLILTGIALYLCFLVAKPFLGALVWALALAIIAFPLHRRMDRWIRQQDLSAAASVLIVAITVVGPGYFVGQQMANQATQGVEQVRQKLSEEGWKELTNRNPRLARLLRWVEARADLRDAANRMATFISTQAVTLVTVSVRTVIGLLLAFFFLFYFLRDHQQAADTLRLLLPLNRAEADRMFCTVVDTVQATFYGTLAVALVQGLLGGLMFWWLGLPAPVLWGLVMAVVAAVPVLGAFVVWLPAAIVLALQGAWGKAVILTLWGALVISLVDNLLYPVLVGRRLHYHTLPVFIALVGGLMLFGTAGFILGPMLLAITMSLLRVWRERTADGETAESGVRAKKA